MDEDHRELVRRLFAAATEMTETAHEAAIAGQSEGLIAKAYDRWPGSGGAHTGPPPLMAAGTRPNIGPWELDARRPRTPIRGRRSFDWTSRAKEALLWGSGPEGCASGPPAPPD